MIESKNSYVHNINNDNNIICSLPKNVLWKRERMQTVEGKETLRP